MIINNLLVIKPGIPEFQEFTTLLYESGRKLECPFTSAEVDGYFSETDFRNAIHLLDTLNLKLKFPDIMIDAENKLIVINGVRRKCQEFTRLLFESGVKLECPFTSAKVVGKLSKIDSTNAIYLLKTFNRN